MTSLTEAFFIGGARAVVSSLWTVDDNYTSLLMERFYSHLSKGEDKALALTNAKLDLLSQNKGQLSPYYWAGFTISGEASTSIPISRP
jgi:CHAT domain-containing protein